MTLAGAAYLPVSVARFGEESRAVADDDLMYESPLLATDDGKV